MTSGDAIAIKSGATGIDGNYGIYVNRLDGKVAIGGTSTLDTSGYAEYNLEVQDDNMAKLGIFSGSDSRKANISLGDNSTDVGWQIEFDGNGNYQPLHFKSGYPGSSKVTFLDNGNVGIGTDDPSAKLEVNGIITVPCKDDQGSGDANPIEKAIKIGDNSYIYDSSCNDGGGLPSDTLHIKSGEKIEINSALSVDIKSDVNIIGDGEITLEVTDDVDGTTARIRITDLVENAELQLQYGSNTEEHWAIYNHAFDDSLRIWSYNGGDFGDRISVHQNGDITSDGTICDSNGCIGQGGDDDWEFSGNDIYRVNGNVGIGIVSPGYKLEVTDDVNIYGTGDTDYRIEGKRSIGDYPGWGDNELYINAWGDWTSGTTIAGTGGLLVNYNLTVEGTSTHSFAGTIEGSNFDINGGNIASATVIEKDPVITLGTDLSGSVELSNLGNGILDAYINSGVVGSSEIANDTIQEIDLEVTNSPTDGYILSYDLGTEGFTWVEGGGGGISEVKDDTSPQLGGDLDVGTNKIQRDSTGSSIEFDGNNNVIITIP